MLPTDPATAAPTRPTSVLEATLLWVARVLLLLVPLVPLVSAGPWDYIPTVFFPDITPKHFVFRGLVEVAFGLWLVLACMRPAYRVPVRGVLLAMVAFTAVMALANVLGRNPSQSIWSNFERMQGLVGQLHLVAFLVVAAGLLDRRWWRRFWGVVIAVGCVVGVFGVFQVLHSYHGVQFDEDLRWLFRMHNQEPGIGRNFRMDARLGSPVFLAAYMSILVFIAVWLCSVTRGRLRWLALAPVLLFVYCLLGTNTRSALAGLVLGALAALLFIGLSSQGRLRRLSLLASGLILLLVIGFAALIQIQPDFVWNTAVLRRFTAVLGSLNLRFYVWQEALQGFLERPVLGWGQENFQYVFDKFYDPRMVRANAWWDHPHNSLLGWLVAGGVSGLAAYLVVVVTPLWQLARRASNLGLAERAALLGALTCYMGLLLWEPDNLASQMLFFALLAYVHAASGGMARSTWQLRGVPLAAIALVVGGLVAFTVHRVNLQNWAVARSLAEDVIQPQRPPAQRLAAAERLLAMPTFARREVAEQVSNFASSLAPRRNVREELKQRAFQLGEAALRKELVHGRLKTLVWLGLLYRSFGDYRRAVEQFDLAREMAPTRLQMHLEAGRCYMLLKQIDQGIAAFRTAMELNPTYNESKILLWIAAVQHARPELEQEMFGLLHNPARTPRFLDSRMLEIMIQAQRWEPLLEVHRRQVEQGEEMLGFRQWTLDWLTDRTIRYAAVTAAAGDVDKAVQIVRDIAARNPEFKPRSATLITLLRGRSTIYLPWNAKKNVRAQFSAAPQPGYVAVPPSR